MGEEMERSQELGHLVFGNLENLLIYHKVVKLMMVKLQSNEQN